MNNQNAAKRGKMSNESFVNLFMVIVLIGLFLIASLFVPNFFTTNNMVNLLTKYWYLIILGIGVTFLLTTGNFDMSVGGIIAMTGVLSVFFCQNAAGSMPLSTGLGLPYGLAILLALIGALCIGAINAFFIAKLRVASIIITLGTMSFARGIAQIITMGAQRNTALPPEFGDIGNTFVPGIGIKLSVLIMVIFVIIALTIEKKTVFGRRTYLIGANMEAARLSGVKVTRHVTALYLVSAFLAGITGILLASEYKAGLSNRALGFEFDALVITLLGGTSIAGGFGSVLGTVVGALIFAVITTSATGLLFPPDLEFIIKGVVTFLAILAQRFALDRRKG